MGTNDRNTDAGDTSKLFIELEISDVELITILTLGAKITNTTKSDNSCLSNKATIRNIFKGLNSFRLSLGVVLISSVLDRLQVINDFFKITLGFSTL